MVEIGGKPILWHIMKIYSAHGINDFVICLGYKGYMIKEYFANYFLHMSRRDVRHRAATRWRCTQSSAEPWRVTLVDTGEETQTGGRLRRVRRTSIGDEEFCFTYGDGVTDVDIARVDRLPPARRASSRPSRRCSRPGASARWRSTASASRGFDEKPHGDGGWINGGFFVLSPAGGRLHRRTTDTVWEREPLERLARERPARRLRPRRLLAPDGHAAGQEPPRGALGTRARRRGRRGSEPIVLARRAECS